MRYCYCPECDRLRPSNWYSRGKCEICGGECVNIDVKRTFKGYLMYLLDTVAVIFIVVYLLGDTRVGVMGNPVQYIGLEGVAIIIFVLVGSSLVFGYLDLKDTTRAAEAKVENIKLKRTRESQP